LVEPGRLDLVQTAEGPRALAGRKPCEALPSKSPESVPF
jgi:hypothetical protein